MSYLIATLNYALSRRRPFKGKGEAELRSYVRKIVGGASTIDDKGNLIIDRRQRHDGGTSRTLFVAHMDTVHKADGRNTFISDKEKRQLRADGAPLGADDGAGVAMLVHLLKHGVPGLYVFTVGEEVGGVGAKYFAQTQREILTCEIDRAIAFDRRGGTSIITHQGWGKCASNEFAEALAEKLGNAHDALLYMPDDTGVYTDTAEFVDMVAECTNISVGYQNEHGDREMLDMAHFEALAEGVLRFDWDSLPAVRQPGDNGYEARVAGYGWDNVITLSGGGRSYGGCTRDDRFALYDALDAAYSGKPEGFQDFMYFELLGMCEDEISSQELEAFIYGFVDYDDALVDALYDAADAHPGDEINAMAIAFARELHLWEAVEMSVAASAEDDYDADDDWPNTH